VEEKKALLEITHGDFEAWSRCPAGDVSDALAITNNYVYTEKLTGTAGGRITMPVSRLLPTALRFTATVKGWPHTSAAGRSRNTFCSRCPAGILLIGSYEVIIYKKMQAATRRPSLNTVTRTRGRSSLLRSCCSSASIQKRG
jgi:hypothetical protein